MRTLKVLLPNKGKKECYQLTRLDPSVSEEHIPSIAKQISKQEICLKGRDYFVFES